MKKLTIAAALAAATMLASPAQAADPEGKIQVKLLATGVLPDGKIESVNVNLTAAPTAALATKANDNVVPTLAVEYFATPNISVETICCVTGHHVTISDGALKGQIAVDDVKIIPATLTAKYHLPLGPIKPYIGVGPTLFLMLSDSPSAVVREVSVTRTKLSSELGVAVQAGADVTIGNGFSLTVDAKKYWVSTDATFYAPVEGGIALKTRHRLDPWVVSGGIAYRF